MTALNRPLERAQSAHLPKGTRSSNALPSDPLADTLPRRHACECPPLTVEEPVRICRCRCHSGGVGMRRSPRIHLYRAIKPLVGLSVASALITVITTVFTVALHPTLRHSSAAQGFFVCLIILWTVLNFGGFPLALSKRGPSPRKGLMILIAVNAFLMVWYIVGVIVVVATKKPDPS